MVHRRRRIRRFGRRRLTGRQVAAAVAAAASWPWPRTTAARRQARRGQAQ